MKNITLRLRKLLTLIITCCLIVTTVVPMTAAAEDIAGHWAINDINFLLEKGLVRGDNNGNISPDNNITRAELIALINRTFKFIEVGEMNFPDVEPGTWYYDDLAIAKNKGYIQGDNYGNANPGNPITRAEVTVALARVLELEPQSDASEFDDSASFPSWSVDGIIAMTESGIVGGYPDNTFRASNSITRAEAMTILARIIRLIESEEEEVGDEETPLDTLSGSNISGGGPGGGGPGGPNPVVFADANFKEAVVDNLKLLPGYSNYTKDSNIYPEDLAKITELDVSYRGITSMGELSYFIRLERLYCTDNQLSELDVSKNTALLELYCGENNLAELNVNNNPVLQVLECEWNNLTALDISKNTVLLKLNCRNNNLSTLDVSKNTELEVFDCGYNNLSILNVIENKALLELYCDGNTLSTLDVSKNVVLEVLNCGTNNLSILDVSINTALLELYCDDNNLSELEVDKNKQLQGLDCTLNNISTLDVSNNTDLQGLGCSLNNLSSLDVSNNVALKYLICYDNNLDTLVISKNPELLRLFCDGNKLSSLDVSSNPELEFLYCCINNISTLDISINTKLEILSCYDNNISTLDVSHNTKLEILYCGENNLTALDVSNNTRLYHLECDVNNLTTLDVSNNPALVYLVCGSNNISELDVSNNTRLYHLECDGNNLTTLDVSNNTALVYLVCGNNLTTLDVSKNLALVYLVCSYNNLTTLDVSNNTALEKLYCGGTQLESVYFTRGSSPCSIVANGNGYLSKLSIDFLDGQIQVEASGENDPYWELSGAKIAEGLAAINLNLTDSGMAYSEVNGTRLVANFSTTPHTPLVKLAVVIGYKASSELEDVNATVGNDPYSELKDGKIVTKYTENMYTGNTYTATIITLDGKVIDVPTTAEMYNANTRIGVVSFFDIDNSGRYTFTAPGTDTTYSVDDGITKIEKGSITLHGGSSVYLASSATQFVVVNYMKDPDDNNNRIPDGTATIYTGRNNVPTFDELSRTTAVSYSTDGLADSIADIVFIFDDIYAPSEYSFVYIIGSWEFTSAGYGMDVILEGKVDTITVKSATDHNTLIAMAGELWNNIKVTVSGVLDLSSATQLRYNVNSPSAASTIKNNEGLLKLDGIYSGYTIDDNAPVYIITMTGTFEADIFEGIAEDLDEDDFLFVYLDVDSDQVVSNIYIIKVDI
ncbi:MAG: S-layer homology domain-containing protein [Oscillospiraceae bacterium]|nr:S-layer homology domain-containing protein [Oscillospiraceae bacterium]